MEKPLASQDTGVFLLSSLPKRRLTSVYDLENQVGIVGSQFKFPGTRPVY